ncbi:General transcription factor 3C polypeptide 5 [Oopsacas minuta]|uniref:General transcription factor 3C polypeptide 5 n=1 Tax=Oopsacas minuta TaxID=111878 RepID=A0AAV7JLI8_9METZ|nr:General transcription factor 3C polypeptide 5 [Oopsacas minuta]
MTELSNTSPHHTHINDSVIKFNINPTKLIVIHSPCIVRNISNYLSSLGGKEERNEIFSNKEDRLPFRFRPAESYSKPAFADPTRPSSMLIKVKIPKIRTSQYQDNCVIECMGIVQTLYKFKRPFDFQFLSPALHPLPSKYSLDDYNPYNTVVDSSQLKKDIPLFVLPSSNPRLDWTYLSFKPTDKELTGRARTFGIVHGIKFEEPSVPTVPRKQVKQKEYLLPLLEKLFEERPIWSRVALHCKTGADSGSLRSALSSIAYHFSSGPWKYCWIKFGIDPRVLPKYKWFQIVECKITRLKHARSKVLQASDHSFTTSLIEETVSRDMSSSRVVREHVNNPISYLLTQDTTAQTARLSYQIIDIELDSVRELVHINDGKETVCTKETGWFPTEVQDKIRSIIKYKLDYDSD